MIHFSTMRVGEPGNSQPSAKLYCETLHNCYSIDLLSDGRVFRWMNCKHVPEFPSRARSAQYLESVFSGVRDRLADLLSLPEDSPEYRDAWWAIKSSLKTPA